MEQHMERHMEQFNADNGNAFISHQQRLSVFNCAVIDQSGAEIPITEEMIQSACADMESQCIDYHQVNTESPDR